MSCPAKELFVDHFQPPQRHLARNVLFENWADSPHNSRRNQTPKRSLEYDNACGILAAGAVESLFISGQEHPGDYTANWGDGKTRSLLGIHISRRLTSGSADNCGKTENA
jgi:hypothetical protein